MQRMQKGSVEVWTLADGTLASPSAQGDCHPSHVTGDTVPVSFCGVKELLHPTGLSPLHKDPGLSRLDFKKI